jgi:pectinesterase
MDYNNWISWNIQNYRQKATLKAKSKVEAPGTSRKGLDVKQWKAEMNKVRISVSQNGTSDFKTIREALNSIPLYNTRRVILVISPGVYRYFI